MQVDAFLAELEPLTHKGRTVRMVDVGRRIRRGNDPDAAALADALERPERDARLDMLRRVAALALRDGERVVFGACLARMAGPHPDECRTATAAVLTRMLPDEVVVVVARVRALLPERRLFGPMVEEVGGRLGPYALAHTRRVGEGVLAALAADPLAVPQYVAFASRVLAGKDLASTLASLADRDLLHADAMAAASGAVRATIDPELCEAELAGSRDERLRRLAVTALVAAAAPEHGWTKERRARLEAYRADASPLVAGAATFVFPPD